jgi:hypothetical protein
LTLISKFEGNCFYLMMQTNTLKTGAVI